jgi:Flp pilus assembly protein TadG
MISIATFTRDEEGSEMIEFGLVIIPLFGFLFLIVAVCWIIFAQATLQYAATAGVRFAITRQSTPAIQAVVQQNSLGFITSTKQIQVNYYNPANPKQATGNSAGSVVQIIVSVPPMNPLAPILGAVNTASNISVSAADIVE